MGRGNESARGAKSLSSSHTFAYDAQNGTQMPRCGWDPHKHGSLPIKISRSSRETETYKQREWTEFSGDKVTQTSQGSVQNWNPGGGEKFL